MSTRISGHPFRTAQPGFDGPTIFTKSAFEVFAGGEAARKHPGTLFVLAIGEKMSGFSYFVKTLDGAFQPCLDYSPRL